MTEKERSGRASWHCRADKKKRRSVREKGGEGKERKNKKRIEIQERKNGMMVGKRYKSGTKICVFEKSCWQHREPSLCAVLGAAGGGAAAADAEDTATSVLRTDTAAAMLRPCTGSPTCDYGGRDGERPFVQENWT